MAVSEASDELLEALDQLFYFLEAAESRGGRRSLARGASLKHRRRTQNPLRGWTGILPVHEDYLDTFFDDDTLMGDVGVEDLDRPLSIRMCAQDADCDTKLTVHWFRNHPPLHGRQRVRWYNILVNENGKATASKRSGPGYTVLTGQKDGTWEYPSSVDNPKFGGDRRRHINERTTNLVQAALAFAFELPRHWHVDVGYHEQGPSVAIQTDAAGVLGLFRDREAPKRGRRDALLHWVEEHYRRKSAYDGEATIRVRNHLRGSTRFVWRDMFVTVRPSAEEMRYFLEEDQLVHHANRGLQS